MFEKFLLLLFVILTPALADASDIDTEMLRAAQKGDTAKVKQLVEQGADVNAKSDLGTPALILAAVRGHSKTVKFLIESGADINARDNKDYTALIYAAGSGDKEMVKILLSYDADLTPRNDLGLTALGIAELNFHRDISEMLREAGATE